MKPGAIVQLCPDCNGTGVLPTCPYDTDGDGNCAYCAKRKGHPCLHDNAPTAGEVREHISFLGGYVYFLLDSYNLWSEDGAYGMPTGDVYHRADHDSHPPVLYDVQAAIREQIYPGTMGPAVRLTHDGFPMSGAEDEEADEGEPCLWMRRCYEDDEHRLAIEAAHSPSVWRKPYHTVPEGAPT